MMFVVYWLLLAFGAALTLAGVAFLTLGIFRPRQRAFFLSLGAGSIVLAWLPVAVFFAFLYANGARPAGSDVRIESKVPTAVPLNPPSK
jgi:hypothetical protein